MPDPQLRPIGDVPKGLDKSLWDFLNTVKHNLRILAGTKGDELNKGVTFRDLISLSSGVLQHVSVSDIDSPGELASKRSDTVGSLIIAYNAGYELTVYSWAASGPTLNPPYVVQGDGGVWIAISGKYSNSDFLLKDTASFYFGMQSEDGSWRITRNGTDLRVERRESDVWTEKGAFLAS